MGFADFLAQKFAAGALMETLKAKCNPAYVFVDSLNEVSLPVAVARLFQEYHRLSTEVVTGQVINIEEAKQELDMLTYFVRILQEAPATKPILDFIQALGFSEVGGISIAGFIEALAGYREGK